MFCPSGAKVQVYVFLIMFCPSGTKQKELNNNQRLQASQTIIRLQSSQTTIRLQSGQTIVERNKSEQHGYRVAKHFLTNEKEKR